MTLTPFDFSDPWMWLSVFGSVVLLLMGAFAIGGMWATMPPRRGGR